MSRTAFVHAESEEDGAATDRAIRPLGSVNRAFQALDLIAANGAIRSADLAAGLGTSRSGAYALLRTLETCHVVRQDPRTKEFTLAWKLFELGQGVFGMHTLLRAASGALDRLAAASGESALLAVREGRDVLYVGASESARSVRLTAALGRRTSLHGSASGKALLLGLTRSELDQAVGPALESHTPRTIVDIDTLYKELELSDRRGYTTCLGEWEVSEASVSVPLRDAAGVTLAALTVGGPTERFTPSHIERFAALLADAASDSTRRSTERHLAETTRRRSWEGSIT